MHCYISPNLMKKQTHLHLGWPEGEPIFIVRRTFPSTFMALSEGHTARETSMLQCEVATAVERSNVHDTFSVTVRCAQVTSRSTCGPPLRDPSLDLWIKQICVEQSMRFPSSFGSVCGRWTDLCICRQKTWVGFLYTYRPWPFSMEINRLKCIKRWRNPLWNKGYTLAHFYKECKIIYFKNIFLRANWM